jgi:hypothetical protein
MLRIALCRDCAASAAHQYYSERTAIMASQPDQTPAEASRAAAGIFGTVGVVYFIRFRDAVKIGFTTDLRARLSNLPYEELLGVAVGTQTDEARCHQIFGAHRIVGEWFHDTPEVRAFIADVASMPEFI